VSQYLTVESAYLALVRAYNSGATFTTANSSQNDWRVLDAPGTAYAAVLMMGEDSDFGDSLNGRGAFGKRQELHRPTIELFVKRGQGLGGDGAARADLIVMALDLTAYLFLFVSVYCRDRVLLGLLI
jgi:hypothetical protein